jgi:protocatechuate 3,4-dioxygenase beta subunit
VTRNLASFVLFAVALSAQQAPPSKPGKVEGVVINSVTNDPVKKATVMLQGPGRLSNYAVVTDASGHFHFDSVEPGNYIAMAYRDGFIPLQGSPRTPWSKPIAVAEEQAVKDVVVKLLPLALVSGHVLDEDGDPVVRAQVQALRYVYQQGGARQLNPAGTATTNDLGEYQLLDLEPGRYYFLVAVQPRMARSPGRLRSATPEQAYPNTFYPSAAQAEQATTTQLGAGAQVTGIDFRLHKVAAFHIRGKALDGRTGQPLRNAMIWIQASGSFLPGRNQIQQNGTFDVPGVVSGSYTVNCQMEELSSRQLVDIGDHDVDDIVLVLRPPLEISGTVRLEGDPPPAERRGQVRVNLNAIEMGNGAGATVNPDGSFALKVTPGVYQINASCDAGAYVKSMHFGDQDVTSGKIDLTQQSSGALYILCGTDVGQMQGSVQNENGEPAAQVVVTVVPDDEHQGREDLFIQLMSDQNGKFDYRDIAPGNYKVFAWEGDDFQMLQAPGFRKAFESRAASVTISPGGNASVQVKMIPAADIEAEKNKLP